MNPRNRATAALLLAASLFAHAGCGSGTPPAHVGKVTPQGRLFEADDFSITVPLRFMATGASASATRYEAEQAGLRKAQADAPWPFYERLEDMARDCDILMVSTPGGPATRNLIDAKILDALGPQGVLINIARGSVVDEPALIAALREGRILSAGLDVFVGEPEVPAELVAMDHVMLLPHVGSASHATSDAMSALVVDNAVSFAAGRGPLTPVAETPWPLHAKTAN